ncbi:hypothetical protein GOODEAATRI_028675, partial [Goodea atripinnis]
VLGLTSAKPQEPQFNHQELTMEPPYWSAILIWLTTTPKVLFQQLTWSRQYLPIGYRLGNG